MLDLSSFSREEAVRLLSVSEPPCVRFAVRDDGRPIFREDMVAITAAALLSRASVAAAGRGEQKRDDADGGAAGRALAAGAAPGNGWCAAASAASPSLKWHHSRVDRCGSALRVGMTLAEAHSTGRRQGRFNLRSEPVSPRQ